MSDLRTFWRNAVVTPWLAALLIGLPAMTSAAELAVTVLDRDGEPVPDVAVYVDFAGDEAWMADSKTAVMDQVEQRFVPHLLVVQKGTQVQFPNSDEIAHHVYSFSKPNDFRLPLYKGDAHPPVRFDVEGVATLGCNIHDQMLAYILVVDSDVFGKTDVDGNVRLDLGGRTPESVSIWSPRINLRKEELSIAIGEDASELLTFRLQSKLRSPHGEKQQSLKWADY